MTERIDGLLRAFEQIEEILDAIEGMPKIDLVPLPASLAPLPSRYFLWDEETQQIEGGDLKWIYPFNVRATFKLLMYFETETNLSTVRQLIQKVRLVKDAIAAATSRDDVDWKANIVKVIPMYGLEDGRSWYGADISILVGEYNE